MTETAAPQPAPHRPKLASKTIQFNPFDPIFHQDPYPVYHHLRATDPVHWSPLGVWVVTTYEDVRRILKDARFTTDPVPERIARKSDYLRERGHPGLEALAQSTQRFLFYLNPPDHTRMRRWVGQAFYWSPERLSHLVQEILDHLLQPKLASGHLEVISDLAAPLPVMVIARMLGVPTQDCLKLKPWADELSHILDPLMPLEAYVHLNKMVEQFTTYFEDLIQERQHHPQDDAISTLLAAEGKDLTLTDLVASCIVLFMTGEETTVNTIGNSLLTLLRAPAQLQILRQQPELIPSALEELLRFESPVQLTARVATTHVPLRDKIISPGQSVFLALGAANRDPAQFPDPDHLDVQRSPSSHLAFGEGIHACLGAGLARIQAQLTLQRLLSLPGLELATEDWTWRRHIALRGVNALPITFRPIHQ